MSGKFKWRNVKPGRGNTDVRLGSEWNAGPGPFELPDRATEALPLQVSTAAKQIKLTTDVGKLSRRVKKRQAPADAADPAKNAKAPPGCPERR